MENLPEHVPRVLLVHMVGGDNRQKVPASLIDVVLKFGAALLPATTSFPLDGEGKVMQLHFENELVMTTELVHVVITTILDLGK